MFQTSQQIERLETVDPQCFKKIIVRRQLIARHFEMCGSKTKNFIERVVSSRHVAISNYKLPTTNCKLRQVRLRTLILHKFPQPFFDSRTRIKVTENFDLLLQFLIRNRLDERLRCCGSSP